MDSSSESDTYDRPRWHRSRARGTRMRAENTFPMDTRVPDISIKIETLANTLQDTSRNLNKVDRMLEQYKEHTDDQTEAMATLRESLEESIQHLQEQRKSTSGWSTSHSLLQTSDLEDGSTSERRYYLPMSTLRNDEAAVTGNRRRSSFSVRFRDPTQTEDQIHSLHQSLKDIRSDQLRMGDNIDREISRRNRTDIETKMMLENLEGHIQASEREKFVSLRVERRLQGIEDEMCLGNQRNHTKEPKSMTAKQQEEALEADETFKNRLQRSDSEKNKMEQELERLRKQLDQSECGRDTLLQQMDEMRSQLLRIEKDRKELQRELSLLLSQQRSARRHQRRGFPGFDSEPGESGIEDLQLQLGRIHVSSDVKEMKKSIEQKEREKTQLAFQVEALSADLERREMWQLQMLSHLKEIQSLSENNGLECAQLKSQLMESKKGREELRSKAQQAVRQWKTKCKKLERELQEIKIESRNKTDKNKWSKEREGILSQQMENARRQLTDALGCLAQREEDVRCCEVDLAEARSRLATSELELREARESIRILEEESQKQVSLHFHLREENIKLQECVKLQEKSTIEEQRSLLDLQVSNKNLRTAKADLTTRLAEVESSKKNLEKQLTAAQEESSSFGRQLELERQVHQKELSHLQMTQQEGKVEQERDVHNKLRLYQRKCEELEALVRDLKSGAQTDGELRSVLQLKLDKMKTECDKLSEQLRTSKESHTQLLRKYHTLRKELNIKVMQAKREEERRQSVEHSMAELQQRLNSLQTEHESILHATGAQIDAACQLLSSSKLEAIALTPGLQKDYHRWLAEVKTKLQWLCEEVQEREAKERRLRKSLQHHKEQMKALKETNGSELQRLLDHITLQERLLNVQFEKKGLLEKSRKKKDELRNIQSAKLAMDHLESVPEKLSLLENFKDLEESQRQREMVEQRYARYKEIVGDLQHQLEESKQRIQECGHEKFEANCQGLLLTGLTSSLLSQSSYLTRNSLSTHNSPQKCLASPDLESSLTQENFANINGPNSEHTSV